MRIRRDIAYFRMPLVRKNKGSEISDCYIARCMAKQEVSPDSVDFHFVVQHFHLSEILYNASYQKRCVCNMNGTLQWRRINAEFSLQNVSHNSRENNQQQSWSQICEL